MKVIQIPAGTKGFDCNTPVSFANARKFMDAGFRFALRYLPRVHTAPHDLSHDEVHNLMQAGLAVMGVQHVEAGEWIASKQKGEQYGKMAAAHADACGIALGTCIWLDLESVDLHTPKQAIIDYCNTWWACVAEAGYTPGIYVGWQCGLNASELYMRLKFEHYWSAYNLNKDQFPAIRGVEMKQGLERTLAGIKYDPDVVQKDNKGNLPLAFVPNEWDV